MGVSTRWNEHPDGSSFAPLLSRLVDDCCIIGTIGRDRREGIIDLLEEGTYPSTVRCPTGAEIGGEDLTRVGVDREVELSPSPVPGRFPQMTDMNAEPRIVDEQMDRSIRDEPLVRRFLLCSCSLCPGG